MLGVEEEIRGMLAPPSPDRYGLVMDIETSRSKGSPEPVIEADFRVVEAAAVKRTLAGAERGGRPRAWRPGSRHTRPFFCDQLQVRPAEFSAPTSRTGTRALP